MKINFLSLDTQLQSPQASIRVSIVICSKNRHSLLQQTVDVLLNRIPAEDSVEVIIIEETSNVRPIIRPRVKHFTIPERNLGLGVARNIGLKKASGAIVVFIDDDIIPDNGWFVKLLDPFKDECVGAVGGVILPDPDSMNLMGRCVSLLGFPGGGITRYFKAGGKNQETRFLSTGNCAFRATIAKHIGGFDDFLRWYGEDQDFFTRMAGISKLLFVPHAIVYHKQRTKLHQIFRWFLRRGTGKFTVDCKESTPLRALFLPLRHNFLLKLIGIFGILITLLFAVTHTMLTFLLVLLVLWNHIVWYRHYQFLRYIPREETSISSIDHTRQHLLRLDIYPILWLVKLTMDLGYEIGVWRGFFRYMKHRMVTKPLILTFHNVTPAVAGSAFTRYICSPEHLEEIITAAEHDGYHIVPLASIVSRLKSKPSILFFDKLLALTFDDGYRSIFKPAIEVLLGQNRPLTIFVPTVQTGKNNLWDRSGELSGQALLTWGEIAELHANGADIGAHGRTHVHLRMLNQEEAKEEITGSMNDLTYHLANIHRENILFSYPFGECNQVITAAVREAGYAGAVANYEGNISPSVDLWRLPRFSVDNSISWKDILRRSRVLCMREISKDLLRKFSLEKM